MREIKIVLCKELARIFRNKKMILSTFVLPIVLVVGMFYLMDMISQSGQDEVYVGKVAVVGAPKDFTEYANKTVKSSVKWSSASEVDALKDELKAGTLDLLVVFGDSFESDIDKSLTPDVGVFYDSTKDHSYEVYNEWVNVYLGGYKNMILEDRFGSLDKLTGFTINAANENPDQADSADISKKMLSSILPYFITILIFAGAMSLGVDMIAGEKERGTLSSLLITPVSRTKIIMGKIIALMILSVLSAVSYIVGILLTTFIGSDSGIGGFLGDFANAITPLQLVQMLVILIGIVFLYVSLICLTSVFAKDTKEGSTYVMPLYIVVVVVGILTMESTSVQGLIPYMIPVYNCPFAFGAVIMGNITAAQFVVSMASMLITAGIVTVFIAKLFKSEKIMFNA